MQCLFFSMYFSAARASAIKRALNSELDVAFSIASTMNACGDNPFCSAISWARAFSSSDSLSEVVAMIAGSK